MTDYTGSIELEEAGDVVLEAVNIHNVDAATWKADLPADGGCPGSRGF